MAFQAANSRLWVIGIGSKELNFDMMPGTSPAISPGTGQTTPLTGTVVFHGANGNLWAAGANSGTGKDHGVAMAPGTNASISTDGSRLAFQGANGNLWTTNGSSPTDRGLAMAPGTTPSIGNPNRIAYHGADGNLWTTQGGRTGWAMAPGTSPATSQDGVIAFQGATGTLWIIRVGGATKDTGYPMAPGTSPSMSTMSKDWNLTRIAFQGNDGQLHTTRAHVDRLNKDYGYDLMPGTNPTVSSDADELGYHGSNGHLYEITSSDNRRDLGHVLAAGTSPA